MRSKLIYIIFVIGVLMAGIVIAICLADPVAGSGGTAHPLFPGMQQGGDGGARLEHIGSLAYAFQCLLLTLICCLCALGVEDRLKTREFWLYIGGCLALMLIAWHQMYSGHQEFLATGTTSYFLGFPVATSWQVYGTWLGAIPLIVIYSLGFRKFIYTEEDEAKFNELLAARAADEAANRE